LPLALSLFNRETAAVLFVYNLGVEIALWTFGLILLAGANPRKDWRKILNPPLLVIIATLALNFLIGQRQVPQFIHVTAHMLGQCAIPFGVLLIGATMADYAHEFRAARGGTRGHCELFAAAGTSSRALS